MINVKQYNSNNVEEYKLKKYDEFLYFFKHSEFPVNEIYKLIGVNITNSTGRYIRKRLRKEGYNSFKRIAKIHKGEWLE